MANPEYLLCDSDLLIQVFLANQRRPLIHLREKYGVSPAIVPEVEIEVRNNQRYKTRFEHALQGSLEREHLVVLDRSNLRSLIAARGGLPTEVGQRLQALLDRGQRYASLVGKGEAYSHAVGVDLKLPLGSHDLQAVQTLRDAGEPFARPLIGFCDLLALAFVDGAVSEEDCRRAIGTLAGKKESVPRALRPPLRPNWQTCLNGFPRRLYGLPSGQLPSVMPPGVLYVEAKRG